MQRPNLLRPGMLLVAVLGMNAGSVMASDYAYAMAAADVADTAAPGEPVSGSGGSVNNRVEGMSARYFVSQDEVPAAATRRDDDAAPAAQSTTSPLGSSGSTTDKRASHRWQALVPGAIK